MTITRTYTRSERSRVELTSDGTRHGTNVWLIIVDEDGHEMRYKIPGVIHVHYEIGGGQGSRKDEGVLNVGLGGVHVDAHVSIGPGRSTIEDLMAEIAAARLRSSDR